MQTTIRSFGYKHGLPLDADMVIDCRFLPNPHWVEDLRALTGLDAPVRAYVLRPGGHEASSSGTSTRCSTLLLPAYVREGKSYLTLAFGCTGGRHRSVAVAEEVARTAAPARATSPWSCTATSSKCQALGCSSVPPRRPTARVRPMGAPRRA